MPLSTATMSGEREGQTTARYRERVQTEANRHDAVPTALAEMRDFPGIGITLIGSGLAG